MNPMLRHQMGAFFGALALGLGAGVSAQPMAAAPLAAGALPASSASAVSPSAAASLEWGGGASARPTSARVRARNPAPAFTAPWPPSGGEPRSAPAVQLEPGRREDLARSSAEAPARLTTNPAVEALPVGTPDVETDAYASDRPQAKPAARSAAEPLAIVAGAAKRAGDSAVRQISRIISVIPN